MNIDLTTIITWFTQQWHWLSIVGIVIAILGAAYSVPNLFGPRRIIVSKMTSNLVTGIIGGITLGLGLTIASFPAALLFRGKLYQEMSGHANDLAFFITRLLQPLHNQAIIIHILQTLLIGCSVSGLLLGLFIGVLDVIMGTEYKHRSSSPTRQNMATPPSSSYHLLIGWSLITFAICFPASYFLAS